MKLVKPAIRLVSMTQNPLKIIEEAGRTCYKSENSITEGSAGTFIRKLLSSGHLAMIEHAWMSYRVVCDRGVSHEIVRHRLFSFAQESTRYCNYEGGVTFVIPPWVDLEECTIASIKDVFSLIGSHSLTTSWLIHLLSCEKMYIDLCTARIEWSPQQARSVLPNSLKTEIVISGNLREWLHFFKLRTAAAAHPQMREIADMLLINVRQRVPVIFEDLSKGD